MSDITIEGAGLYNKQRLRQRPDLREAQIGFNVVHDVERNSVGPYRPARNLPVLFTKGSHVDTEGYIWTQGKVLGKYDRQIYSGAAWVYQDDNKKIGINDTATGEFYAFVDVDGTAQKVAFNDPIWGYSDDIKGVVVPMNGYDSAVQDLYTTLDSAYGIIDPVTGSTVESLLSGTPNACLRDAGDPQNSTLEIVGVAPRDRFRETRNQHYNFQRDIEAMGVAKAGYLTVPFVIGDVTDMILDGVSAPVLATSRQRSVSADQTVLFVEDPDLLQTGNVVVVDAWGNPLLASDSPKMGANYKLELGTLVDFSFAVELAFGKYVNTYPFVEMPGTGTAGIEHQVFYLARKVKNFTTPTATVQQVADFAKTDNKFGYAVIYFNIP